MTPNQGVEDRNITPYCELEYRVYLQFQKELKLFSLANPNFVFGQKVTFPSYEEEAKKPENQGFYT